MKCFYTKKRKQSFTASLCAVAFVLWFSLLLASAPAVAEGEAREQLLPSEIQLELKDVPLKTALKEIERQTDYHFVINDSRLRSIKKKVTLTIRTEDIEEVLELVLSDTKITYKINKKQITLIPPGEEDQSMVTPLSPTGSQYSAMTSRKDGRIPREKLFVQPISVTGKVTDETGTALPGVNVLVKGTTIGTVTSSDGQYTIEAPSAESVLVFSFIGYVSQEIALNGQTVINTQLQPDAETLGEVVVVGYGTQEREDVTGAIASVKGSEIQNLPVASASQALQGRAAGVNVIRSGGAPGNTGSIRIRGIGTVNDPDPLLVIDGVPAININDVNPNDIESIEVLKDASASAIYGTRAANGVVIITTKRGKFGQPLRFTVNGYTGVSNRIKTVDVLDAPTLAMLKRERYSNDGLTVNPVWEDPQYQVQRTDWQKAVLGQGRTNNFDVSVNGGSEKSSFAMAGAVYNEKGMIEKSFYKRYSFRLNSDHKIGTKFKLGQNLQLVNQKESSPNTLSAQDGLLWSAIRFNPALPIKNTDGTYSSTQVNTEFGDINNPVFTVDTQDKELARTRILGSLNGDLEILPGLHAKANFAIDATFVDKREFNILVLDQTRTTSRNTLTVEHWKSYQVLQEYTLSYDKKIGEHSFTLLGGFSSQTFNDRYSMAQRKDFPSEDPSQRYLTAGQAITGADDSRSYDALQSGFGRLNYDFKNKYLATVTLRADASSRFPEENRVAYFPAFSIGWRISEEPFFGNLTGTVSSLKIIGGWGQMGNQLIPRHQYLALISTGYRYSFGDQPTVGAAQSLIPNTNIKWEAAEMANFGFEAGFLQNRLLATVNYFNKQTKDMLLAPPALGSNGTATIPYQNVGQLENKGLEIELGYRKSQGEFTYTLSANATFLENEVKKLYNGNFLATPLYGRSSSEIVRYYEGNAVATFYGWRTSGLYQNQEEIDSDPNISEDSRRDDGLIHPGDVRFVDLNGDNLIDDKDRTIIGSPLPKLTYGINASAGYKGFDLSLFFLGVANVDIYNADRMQGIDPTYAFNMYAETANRWHGEGTSNSIPRMTTARDNQNHRTSDMFVESGAFFRLKNITLGYTLPTSLSEKLQLTRARIYVTGQNLFIITDYSGMDPELGYNTDDSRQIRQLNVDYAQYPQARTWAIGASLSF